MSEKRQLFARQARAALQFLQSRLATSGLGLAAAILLLGAGCSTLRVDVDRDSTIPIPAGATWAWGPEPMPKQPEELDPRVNNSIIHGRVQRAVEAVLAEKGFRHSDPARADFLVEYRVGVRDRRERVTQAVGPPPGFIGYGPYGGWGPGWAWGYYGPPPMVTTREFQYTEGALVIDLVQRATGKLAFRATGTDSITREDGSDEAVREVVTRLLRDLP
jgi:hypothetical protein